jgi:hypothetical protein
VLLAIITAREASAIMIVNLILYLIRVSPLLATQDVPLATAPPCDPLINDLTCQEVKLLISPQQSAACFFFDYRTRKEQWCNAAHYKPTGR